MMVMLILISVMYVRVNSTTRLGLAVSDRSNQQVEIEARRPKTISTYIIEGTGAAVGCIGTTAGIFLMFYPLLASESDHPVEEALKVYAATFISTGVGSTVGTAIGTTVTGRILNQKGSFRNSLLGSVIGVAAGLWIGALGLSAWKDSPEWYAYGVVGTACLSPVVGAVIGYNWGK